jgi:hypothetical protein
MLPVCQHRPRGDLLPRKQRRWGKFELDDIEEMDIDKELSALK